jgi:hypothetical protein
MVLPGAADVITTQQQLGDLVADICAHGVVAYDTEFIGEESFYPKLCLVQVATPERIALIDPLPFGVSGSDLSGLAPLFRAIAAPGRAVLVHSGDTDVEILRRGAGLEPESILDTQVAAALAYLASRQVVHKDVAARNVLIHVLQGERELVKDCRSIARFDLRGIPPMPAGIPQVEVEFLVDENGVLSVTAAERRSGCRAAVQVVPKQWVALHLHHLVLQFLNHLHKLQKHREWNLPQTMVQQ